MSEHESTTTTTRPVVAPRPGTGRPEAADDPYVHVSCCVPPPQGPPYALCGLDVMDVPIWEDLPEGAEKCPPCWDKVDVALRTTGSLCDTVCPRLLFGCPDYSEDE